MLTTEVIGRGAAAVRSVWRCALWYGVGAALGSGGACAALTSRSQEPDKYAEFTVALWPILYQSLLGAGVYFVGLWAAVGLARRESRTHAVAASGIVGLVVAAGARILLHQDAHLVLYQFTALANAMMSALHSMEVELIVVPLAMAWAVSRYAGETNVRRIGRARWLVRWTTLAFLLLCGSLLLVAQGNTVQIETPLLVRSRLFLQEKNSLMIDRFPWPPGHWELRWMRGTLDPAMTLTWRYPFTFWLFAHWDYDTRLRSETVEIDLDSLCCWGAILAALAWRRPKAARMAGFPIVPEYPAASARPGSAITVSPPVPLSAPRSRSGSGECV